VGQPASWKRRRRRSGRTLGEWCREAILRGGSAGDVARHDPALAEIVGVRLLLVNVLRAGWPSFRLELS